MDITTVLMKTLGGPLAKFLLKKFLSEPATDVGEGVFDVAQTRLTEYTDQREAQRLFERLGERIVARLVPLFEQETRNAEISVDAVAAELAETMNGRISAEFFLAGDLDPVRLTCALREVRPLREAQFSAAEVALYDRALDQSVRFVVQVASRLPKYEETYAATSLQRLGRMGDELEEVLDTTRRIERTVAQLVTQKSDADEDFARYEADYRQAVMRNLDYLELFGADISPESRRHALSVAYISLNLKKSAGSGDEAESLPVEIVLNSLGSAEGRLLIRGEAGSGKSTLSRWTAIQAASFTALAQSHVALEEAFTRVLTDPLTKVAETVGGVAKRTGMRAWLDDPRGSLWRMRVPFLLRLRDCKDGQLPGPDEFPTHIASELGNPPRNWVASILREGKALVLLDGIDEVPNVHREDLRRAIAAIVRAYPNNFFLASTRPTAVEEGWLATIGFREAAVDPMSDVDRALFIRKWHEAVESELARLGRPDLRLPQIASELIEQLPEHPQVARLATNPLLCAMICALHRERSRKLPESQAELCEAICHMLLHRRERESGLSIDAFPEAYRALSYNEKRAIVQDIAHYMVRNGESTIRWDRARQSVEESLKQFPDRKGIDADELLKLLIERSGVLRETRPQEIDFIHNTLKEYLAAERFADADDAGQLADRYADASWRPVILFSVATNRREFATKVVQRVLHPNTKPNQLEVEELRARRLFALRCRAAALHLSPAVIAELDAITASLFPPRSMADAEALASGGDTAVGYLHLAKGLGAREAAACVRALRLIGTRKAEEALQSYLNDSRKTVVSELAQALNPLAIRLVRNMLQQGESIPRIFRGQITDLRPLKGLKLNSLDLSEARITDLTPLTSLISLRFLDLAYSEVTDLAPLSELANLASLILTGTDVNDLSPLVRLVNLRSLELKATQVSNLAPLAEITHLESLNLFASRVDDLSPLAGLINLQRLNLWNTPVTDITSLSGLTNLKWLDLMDTGVTDIVPLAGLINLESLDLGGTKVSDLTPLYRLTKLSELNIRRTEVSDLTPLINLGSLESLTIANTAVSDLRPLVGIRKLQILDMQATQVSDLSPLIHLDLDELYISATLDCSLLEGKPGLKIYRTY